MTQVTSLGRHLADCPAVLLIVYTTGPEAEVNGYEPWLVRVDNPFFNAIPGVHHYANWVVTDVLRGGSLPFTHFDFQGLDAEASLEKVWFNEDLDGFRREWIRLWGYGTALPSPMLANAYLMRPSQAPTGDRTPFALITAGRGTPPPADLTWRVKETIRKHFAIQAGGPWRVPSAADNPLGLDWVAVSYGDSQQALAEAYVSGNETVAFIARLIAAPDAAVRGGRSPSP